jgi:hypothetical protein
LSGCLASTGDSNRMITGRSLEGASIRHRGVVVCSRHPQ